MIYTCIPVHNRVDKTLSCIESIKKQTYKYVRIVICDDGSTDNTGGIIRERFPDVVVLPGDGNLWWTGGTNRCVEYALEHTAKEDFIFTLNNDTELLPDALQRLVETAANHPRSIVGGVNVFFAEPGRIEPSAYRIRGGMFFGRMHKRINEWGDKLQNDLEVVEVDSLSGKGVLIPASAFREVGLYNAGKLPHYHADTELVFRANRKGYKVYLDYKAKVLSHQELSGLGTVTSKPSISGFLKSFSSLKSANHYQSLRNYCELLYGKSYRSYLAVHLSKIVLGFFRRYLFVRP
jgi:GT2 family glycosyltransferase